MVRRLVTLLSCLAACSTDSFGTDGGPDASADAQQPGQDAVATDAPALDSGPSTDASDGSVPTSFSCSTPPVGTLLCDDFESSLNVASKWTTTFTLGGGAVSLDTSVAVSPTHSAVATVPALSGVGWGNLLYQATSVMAQRLELRADVRVHQLDNTQPVPLLRISYAAAIGNGEADYDLVASGAKLMLATQSSALDGGVVVDSQTLTTFSVDKWFNARYEVDTSGTVPTVTVWIDTVQLASRAFVVSPPSPSVSARSINVGIVYESATAAADVNYDNVNFRAF